MKDYLNTPENVSIIKFMGIVNHFGNKIKESKLKHFSEEKLIKETVDKNQEISLNNDTYYISFVAECKKILEHSRGTFEKSQLSMKC